MRSIGEKCLLNSSVEKIIAVIGDDAAREKPAEPPPVIMYLRQPRCFSLPKQRITPSPIAVPICTHGPSVPSGIPHKKVRRAENGSTKILASHLKLVRPLIAATEEGIPPPRQV